MVKRSANQSACHCRPTHIYESAHVTQIMCTSGELSPTISSMSTVFAEYEAARDCDLMVVGELRDDRSYGFACRKETTICRDLDVAILKVIFTRRQIFYQKQSSILIAQPF